MFKKNNHTTSNLVLCKNNSAAHETNYTTFSNFPMHTAGKTLGGCGKFSMGVLKNHSAAEK